MKNAIARILIKLFFKEKFIGQIAAVAASVAASYLIGLLPKAPEMLTNIIGIVLDLPEGSVLTQTAIVAYLTPLIVFGINTVVGELIARSNNEALRQLEGENAYFGPLDSWVGPKALEGIDRLSKAYDMGVGGVI